MALGYCMYCETLRTIRPGPQKWGSRECDWYPTTHWINACGTCKSPVVIPDVFVDTTPCPRCGPVHLSTLLLMQCPGERKAIK
jgi:hypothetical protein